MATLKEREAELKARFKDLTKPEVPFGSTGESLRSNKAFENITDEMLEERATFNLKDHMAGKRTFEEFTKVSSIPTFDRYIDLTKMSGEELAGLAEAVLNQMATRQNEENHG